MPRQISKPYSCMYVIVISSLFKSYVEYRKFQTPESALTSHSILKMPAAIFLRHTMVSAGYPKWMLNLLQSWRGLPTSKTILLMNPLLQI